MIPFKKIVTPLNQSSGFTFVELMVIVAVLSVLSAIAIFNYMPMRAKAADSVALSDTKNFVDSVVKAITNSQNVDYFKGAAGGPIGDTDTAGNPRAPVFSLSPGVAARITGDSAQAPNGNTTIVLATIYHTGGTTDGTTFSGKKEYSCTINENTGVITITIP